MDQETREMFNLILTRLDNIDGRLDKHSKKFAGIEARLDNIDGRLDEHSEYLQALLHSAEIGKSERDKMNIDIAKTQGGLEKLKNDFKIHKHKIVINTSDAEAESEAEQGQEAS